MKELNSLFQWMDSGVCNSLPEQVVRAETLVTFNKNLGQHLRCCILLGWAVLTALAWTQRAKAGSRGCGGESRVRCDHWVRGATLFCCAVCLSVNCVFPNHPLFVPFIASCLHVSSLTGEEDVGWGHLTDCSRPSPPACC